MKGCVWLIFCLSLSNALAQNNADASNMALAGADMVTMRYGYQEQNPATLTQLSKNTIGAQQLLRFSIKELQQNSIYMMTKLWGKPIAVGYQHQGFENYRLNHYYLCSALNLNEKISVGVKIKFNQLYTNQGTADIMFQPEIGCIYVGSEKIQYALHIQLPMRTAGNVQWQSRIKSGIGYSMSNQLKMYYALEYYEMKNAIHALALNYAFIQNINFNISVKNENPFIGVGIHYTIKSIVIENAYNYHTQLGISPCIGVNYLF